MFFEGVGSTLGLGLYVLAGQVASNKAGPGVVISFALAALASAFSALCYAEFAGRVPRAGSAYAYSYITVGEFVAFIIGWNLILEYVIGASSVARGFSGYLRFVFNHIAQSLSSSQQSVAPNHEKPVISHHLSTTNLTSVLPINNLKISPSTINHSIIVSKTAAAATTTTFTDTLLSNSIVNYLVEYFDWPSVAIIFVLTIFILFGVKESTNVTLAFTVLNLIIVFAVVVSSLSYLDFHNWHLSKNEVPIGYGEGGFLPYGWSGVLAGSATCFFGFIGFDTIASSAEEAKNPKRNVPLSILLSLFISFIAYMSIAIVQTLLWPYHDQNKVTILPYIFDRLNMPITYWVVLLGAIAGLSSSQLGGMYPLPRILYSIANDRLIYNWLAKINRRLKLPVRATIVGSIFVAALACLLDIQDLADMVSIGTLAAYSLVSLSVLILRYEDRSDAIDDTTIMSNHLNFNDILTTIENSTNDATHSTNFARQTNKLHNNSNKQQMIIETKFSKTAKEEERGREDGVSSDADQVINSKQKLTSKDSIPIRERGSKAVVAQLSVGFDSWYKNDPQQTQTDNESQTQDNEENLTDQQLEKRKTTTTSNKREKKGQTYMQLLTSWKADEQLLEERGPDDISSRKSKVLISIIVILCIALDIVSLILTNLDYSSLDSQEKPTTALNASGQFTNHHHQKQQQQVDNKHLHELFDPRTVLFSIGSILLVLLAAVMLMLSRLPTSRSMPSDMFQVPFVPLIPTLSLFVNTFLMLNLSYLTWVRFTVWMAFGLFIYFTYGIWNSEGYLLYTNR